MDLSEGIAGAVAGMVLGDLGADVVMVEPQGGKAVRQHAGSITWGRNKRSLLVDGERARAQAAALLASADVCLCSDPGGLELMGLTTAPGLAARFPRLVVASLPPLRTGLECSAPAESGELLSCATGLAWRQASSDGAPVDLVYPHALYLQGLWGATCTVAALVERLRSGSGQVVTVDGLHAALLAGTPTYLVDPYAPPAPAEPPGPGGPNPCYTLYRCRDGRWLFLGALTPPFQERAFQVLGTSWILDDPRIAGDNGRLLLPENRAWLRAAIGDALAQKDRSTWLRLLAEADCPAGATADRDAWLDHPQVGAIGMRVELEDNDGAAQTVVGCPLQFSETPASVRSPLPPLGSDGELAWLEPQLPAQLPFDTPTGSPAEGQRRGPLAGYRILDLGTILAGPFAGCLLASLGAEVVKVEPPAGDPFRVQGFVYNRGLRSLAVDLRAAEGLAAFNRLVSVSDVVIDNYRLGVLDRLKISFEQLKAVNPQVSSVSITGFGEEGPLAAKPGLDPLLQALSGMMTAQGGSEEPVFLTIAVSDITAAVLAALAAATSLFSRHHTGAGQRVTTSLAAAATFMQSGELTRTPGRTSPRTGGPNFKGPSAFDRYYATADGWIRVQASTSMQRDALIAFAGAPCGVGHRGDDATVATALGTRVAEMTAVEALNTLGALGVPVAVARKPVDLLANDALTASGAFTKHLRADGRHFFAPGRHANFSRTEDDRELRPPGLGEHSREVLGEAGLDEGAVRRLVEQGTIVAGEPLRLGTILAYR